MTRRARRPPDLPRIFRRTGADGLREQTQERFRYFLRILGFFHGSIVFIGVLAAVFFLPRHADTKVGVVIAVDLALAVALFGLSPALEKWPLTMGKLAALDWSVTLFVVAAGGVLSRVLPEASGAANLAGLVLTSTLMVRAAIVPSPPDRTFAIGLVASVLSLVTIGASSLGRGMGAWASPWGIVVIGVVHGFFTAIITAAASGVIYGLHETLEDVTRMGQYQLVEKVGEGGMGAVWRAQHAMLRRPTAVKLLAEGRSSAVDLARFEREVQLTSMLTHPNTVAVFDYGRADDGTLYYAMEFVDGLSLEQLVERYGKISPKRVVHILRQVASSLVEAHHLGLIHRDIKPANVLLCERGCVPDFVKVVDFGLAKTRAAVAENTAVSNANIIAGTPAFMAPEMIVSPELVDARADLYALGVVGYYLLTGKPVFEGTNLIELCSHHLHTAPPRPSVLAPVSPLLDALVLDCLAKKPEQRPRSAAALLERLDACAAEEPWSSEEATLFWATHRADPRLPRAL